MALKRLKASCSICFSRPACIAAPPSHPRGSLASNISSFTVASTYSYSTDRISQGDIKGGVRHQRHSADFTDVGAETEPSTAKISLRLMPLGGSVTYGQGSTNQNGYREALRDLLVADGHSVQFVGSRRAGTMTSNHTEGWRGFRIDQIHNKARRSIPSCLPNIVTINAGSNDCIQKFKMDSIGERMGSMLEFVWEASPGSTVILSTLLCTTDVLAQAEVLRANSQYSELAECMAREGKRIVLVDMQNAAGPREDELVDGTHPNDLGYQKMAVIWHKGIQEAISRGFLL